MNICKVMVVTSVLTALAACASFAEKKPDNLGASLSYTRGKNTIKGTAQTISKSGYVRNCSRGTIYLIRRTAYFDTWISEAFQGRDFTSSATLERMLEDGILANRSREGACNGNGEFEFDDVEDGEYYVLVNIPWLLRWQHNGYALLTPVSVKDRHVEFLSMEHRVR